MELIYCSCSLDVCDGVYWTLVVVVYMYRCLIGENCIKTLLILLQFLVCGPEPFLTLSAQVIFRIPN